MSRAVYLSSSLILLSCVGPSSASFAQSATASASATFAGQDPVTEGAWTGAYGADGNVIVGEPASLPNYVTLSSSGAATYIWAASTKDARALQTASGAPTQIASTYYSNKSFTLNVSINDGKTHRLALYLVDWDGYARTETVTILDANSKVVLNTQSFDSFDTGIWAAWNISGNVLIQVTSTGGANAVLSGLFFDPAVTALPGQVSYDGADTFTQGNWVGTYGSQGGVIANSLNNLPAFATMNLSDASTATWAASTTDPRALQTASGASSRIASTYYSSGRLNIRLNLTYGNAHRIALYLLDWDSSVRTETISILDADTLKVLSTQAFSNFHNGVWASWNVTGAVIIEIRDEGAESAVVAGIFFDPPQAQGPPSTARYTGLDTATHGTWTNTYGSNGNVIANDAKNVPSFATVNVFGAKTYTWATPTTDVRALQTASGASSRIASTYYSSSSFSIGVNLTDRNAHRIALYLLDWDSSARAETIKILDANTLQVLDTESFSGFHAGDYAAWTVSGDVVIQVTRTAGPNAVVSGIFFDTLSTALVPVLTSESFTSPAALSDQTNLCNGSASFRPEWTWSNAFIQQPAPATSGTPKIEQVRNGVVIATWQYLGSGTCGGNNFGTYLNPQASADQGCGPFGRAHYFQTWLPGDTFLVYPAVYSGAENQPYIGPTYQTVAQYNAGTPNYPTNITIRGVTVNGVRPVIYVGPTGGASDTTLGQGIIYLDHTFGMTIENIDLDNGGSTSAGRGAVYMFAPANTTLRQMRVHGFDTSQTNGIFGTIKGSIVIDQDEIYQNGGVPDSLAHNVYISDFPTTDPDYDPNTTVIVTNSWSHDAYAGHLFKSRAVNNTIQGSYFQGGVPRPGFSEAENYDLDIPNGGNAVVRDNIFVKNHSGDNSNGISLTYALEGNPDGRAMSVDFENNTFIALSQYYDSQGHGLFPMAFFYPSVVPGSSSFPTNLTSLTVSKNLFAGYCSQNNAVTDYRGDISLILGLSEINTDYSVTNKYQSTEQSIIAKPEYSHVAQPGLVRTTATIGARD